MTDLRPYVAVQPGMRGGQPTINGTRLSVDALVGLVWAGETVDEVADEYSITRADVLVAAWFAGTYGLPGTRRKALAATRWWRERWGPWAQSVHDALWSAKTEADYRAVPDPPSGAELEAAASS